MFAIHQPPRKGKYTLILDSSQLVTEDECPQRWVYQNVKKLEPRGFTEADVESMNAGTYGHKLLEIYYRNLVSGTNLNDNIDKCLAYNPDVDTCICGCHVDTHKFIEILNMVECTRCKQCLKFVAKPFALSDKNRVIVRNRFRDYVFKYHQNEFVPLSENHVEVGFSEPIYEDPYNLFVLEGRIDLIARLQGLQLWVDHKFQQKTHWLYDRSIQFKNYALVTKIPMFMINYVRLQINLQPDSLFREVHSFTSHELAGWKTRLIKKFFNIKEALQNDTIEKRWGACSGSYMTYDKTKPKYCWYGPLCEELDETMRLAKEKNLFQIKPMEWRPW